MMNKRITLSDEQFYLLLKFCKITCPNDVPTDYEFLFKFRRIAGSRDFELVPLVEPLPIGGDKPFI